MKTTNYKDSLLELLALVMIGEGIIGLLRPRRHLLLWALGPQPLQTTMETLAEKEGLSRCLFAAELGAGLALAFREVSREQSCRMFRPWRQWKG